MSAFTGCYYNTLDLSGDPALVRTDNQIAFNWGITSFSPYVTVQNFSVRWQGNFTFSQGDYIFTAVTSDGMRVYIDGNIFLDRWRDQAPTIYTSRQTLNAGVHLITVEYYQHTGSPQAQLSWTPPSPPGVGQPPAITSFLSSPTTIAAGQAATLSWNVSGATALGIDNGVGDVTAAISKSVSPAQTTTFNLTASNSSGVSTASVTVTVNGSTTDSQPPTTPSITSIVAKSSTEVDLSWNPSNDNVGVAGYQITRNGNVIGSVTEGNLSWSDTSVSANTTYSYTVKAYDAAGNYSSPSGAAQITTPAPTITSTPTSGCPAPVAGAFTGCYYNGIDLSGAPALARTDNQINFDWGIGAVNPSVNPQNFSVRWQGTFSFSQGIYKFTAITSDGMRAYIDGASILDRWRDQAPTGYTAQQTVTAGNHLVTVEYYEHSGSPTAHLSWQPVNTPQSQGPAITSFTSSPSAVTAGQAVKLAWVISGATSVAIDNSVGDVTTLSTISVFPSQTTTYTLTASNSAGSTTASVTVAVTATSDTQVPTAPTLRSAVNNGAAEVDLVWSASVDNTAVMGYQIVRNGSTIATVSGGILAFADTSVSPASIYTYGVKAFDAAGNYSPISNTLQVTTPTPTQSGATCPAPAAQAFTGCYYNNINLAGNPVFIRTDSQINFAWGSSSPDPSLTPLNFSARWQGNFTFGQGTYTFTAVTSDGMRIYIDGNAILNTWKNQPPYQYTVSSALTQGTHLVTVEYYELQGGATAQVAWQLNSPVTPAPTISSFSATPSSIAPGQNTTLTWATSGATSVSINSGVGDVTGRSAVTVNPTATTTYTLTASSTGGAVTATLTVTVRSSTDTQSPTPPTLISATAQGGNEVDLVWSPSTDNVGVIGYQINRNGVSVGTISSSTLVYGDTTVSGNTTYTYTLQGYDAAGNYSAISNSQQVTTPTAPTVSVTWYGACWQAATIYGNTGNFQAIDFLLATSSPVPLQGTLFFAANCDPSQGQDNMNDYNSLTGSTHMIQGFSHFPNVMPSSAYYWIGNRTADGKCSAGSICSGCVNYNQNTPSCDILP